MGFPFAFIERLSDFQFGGEPIALAGALAAGLLLVRLRRSMLRIKVNFAAAALGILLLVASVLAPSGHVWRHVGAILLVSLVGALLAQSDLVVRLREVVWLATGFALISLGSALLLPRELTFVALGSESFTGVGIVPDGKLVGVAHGLSLLFALSVVVLCSPYECREKTFTWRWALMLAPSSLALVLSNSLSLVVGVVTALAIIWAALSLRKGRLVESMLILISFLLVAGVLFLTTLSSGISGRGESLTGRLPIWRNVLSQVKFGLMGAGPGQFWRMNGSNENLYVGGTWRSYSTHNSWLNVVLDYGLVGLFVVVGVLVATVLVLLTSTVSSKVIGGGFLCGLIVGASTGDVILEPTPAFAIFVWLILETHKPPGSPSGDCVPWVIADPIEGRRRKRSEKVD